MGTWVLINRRWYKPMSVAERKRRQRARLKDAGFKPVEVWIPAEHRGVLRQVEKMLRRGDLPNLQNLRQSTQFGLIGKEDMDLNLLTETLNDFTSENGFRFGASQSGDNVQVVVEDREEFPILVSSDDEQILCVVYLWDESQVKPAGRTDMLAALLEMNVPLPLSSFGMIGDRYVLFGALAANSSVEDIITELETLSDNTLEAIEAIAEFLN